MGLAILGLFGGIVLLVVVFGKRVRKQWEFEAEFRDAQGAEFGEFDIESSMIDKQDSGFRLRASLDIRHEMISPNVNIQVLMDNQLVLEGVASAEGKAFLYSDELPVTSLTPQAGQRCVVLIGGIEVATADLHLD